tara:strand:- start:853 stop:1023 length:171 start_codon:yes stop_codon:yes gene_type:complete
LLKLLFSFTFSQKPTIQSNFNITPKKQIKQLIIVKKTGYKRKLISGGKSLNLSNFL